MKRNRTLLVLIASSLIGAPAGFAQNGLTIHTAQPIHLTVAPNVSSPITMRTLPQATCVLHAEGDNDNAHRLKLFADDEGIVRFHLKPDAESDQLLRFEVDCAANDEVSIFPLELRSSSSPTTEMPAPAVEVAKATPGTIVRPALTEDEALRLSDEELKTRGYLSRPDPEQTPDAFATWLKAVTKPATHVQPRLVVNRSVTHSCRQGTLGGYGTSSNWSGFRVGGVRDGISQDLGVKAAWFVPKVSGEVGNSTYSSFWIGLDGSACNVDLVQEGTEQDIVVYYIGGTPCCPARPPLRIVATSYYAFTEAIVPSLSLPTGEQVIPNFTVNPGDLVSAEIDVAVGNYPVTFSIENLSRSEYTTIHMPIAPYINGRSAEWIVERPTVNGVLPDLSDYGAAYMYSAYAHVNVIIHNPDDTTTHTFNWLSYGDTTYFPPAEQISMYNTVCSPGTWGIQCKLDLLSTVNPATSTDMQFVWNNFH